MEVLGVVTHVQNGGDKVAISEHFSPEILRLVFKNLIIDSLGFELKEIVPGVLLDQSRNLSEDL